MAKFEKGITPWNKGIPCSDETKAKISVNRKGKKHTPEMQEKLNINLKAGEATRFSKGQEPWNKGKKNPKFTPEEIKEHQKEWRKNNREKIDAATKKWKENNPEAHKKIQSRTKQKNSGRVNALNKFRQLEKKNRTPKWLNDDDVWVMKEIYDLAAQRTKLFGFAWHVDHIIPLKGKTVSGLHVPNNLRVIEGTLNLRKNNKFEGEYFGVN